VGTQRRPDALGKIGGPKVIDASCNSSANKDEDLSRARPSKILKPEPKDEA